MWVEMMMTKAIPVGTEQAEGAVGLHEGQLALVQDVHVVEGVVLLGAVALVDEPHVQRQVHVRCETEHVLFRRVLYTKRHVKVNQY